MITLLNAQAVQAQLQLRSRAKAIEIMALLPHIDLAPSGSCKRNLRVTEATLDAYCQGQIQLKECNERLVIPRKTGRRFTPKVSGEFVTYRS